MLPEVNFLHRGEKNSFAVKPISAYDKGESQNPQPSQVGMDDFGITKPPNNARSNTEIAPVIEQATNVRQIDAIARNIDIHERWNVSKIMKCRKNLKESNTYH
jgi:hypothetical protein